MNVSMGSSPLFTICVPSFNRGRKALDLVNDILPHLQSGWILMVIENCAFRECDDYEKILAMSMKCPERLTFFRNKYNTGFAGNFLNCFRNTTSNFIMLVSDEDRPNLKIISSAIQMMTEKPGIGIVRGGVAPLVAGGPRRNSFVLKDVIYTAGNAALSSYALSNNYFSGTIYNRELLSKFGVLDRLEKQLMIHHEYPHLYLECLTCAIADVALSSEIACFEGVPQTIANSPCDYSPPYSIGARMDQFMILRDALCEAVELVGAPFNGELFANLYLKHAVKYFHLIGKANASMYETNRIDVGIAVRSFAYLACAGAVRHEHLAPFGNSIVQKLDELAKRYGG